MDLEWAVSFKNRPFQAILWDSIISFKSLDGFIISPDCYAKCLHAKNCCSLYFVSFSENVLNILNFQFFHGILGLFL